MLNFDKSKTFIAQYDSETKTKTFKAIDVWKEKSEKKLDVWFTLYSV